MSEKAKKEIELLITKKGDGISIASEELKKLIGHTEKGSEAFEKLEEKAGEAVKSIREMGDEAIKSHAAAEKATVLLNTALKATKSDSAEYVEQLQKQKEELSALSNASGEQITRIQAQLLLAGASKDQIKDLTEATVTLGFVTGDMGGATTKVISAIGGETKALESLGIQIDQNASRSERMIAIVSGTRDKYGTLLQDFAKTDSARLEAAKGSVEDLKEVMGELTTKAILPSAEATAKVSGYLTEVLKHNEDVRALTTEFISLGNSITSTAGALKMLGVARSGPIGVIAASVIEVGKAGYAGYQAADDQGKESDAVNTTDRQQNLNLRKARAMIEEAKRNTNEFSPIDGDTLMHLEDALNKAFEQKYGLKFDSRESIHGSTPSVTATKVPLPPDLTAQNAALRLVAETFNPPQAQKGQSPEQIAADLKRKQADLEHEEAVKKLGDLEKQYQLERMDGFAQAKQAVENYYQAQEKVITAAAQKGNAQEEGKKTLDALQKAKTARLEKIEEDEAEAQRQRMYAELDQEAAKEAVIKAMRDDLTLAALEGTERQQKAEEIRYDDEADKIKRNFGLTEELRAEMLANADKAHDINMRHINEEAEARAKGANPPPPPPPDSMPKPGEQPPPGNQDEKNLKVLDDELKGIGLSSHGIATEVSQLGTNMFTSMIQGTKSAGEAIKEFFKSLLAYFAQAIMQAIMLRLVLKLLGSIGGAMSGGGTAPRLAATGAIIAAASGVAGVQELNRTTYFPEYNVVAGEAGREMMAVFAKPQSTNVAGLPVITGSVGGNRLAMLNEKDLARLVSVRSPISYAAAGMVTSASFSNVLNNASNVSGSPSSVSGQATIRVVMERGLRLEIVDEAISGARIAVENDLHQDTTISRSVKSLTS